MDLNFLTQMYMPIIMALCLVVGYILKHWIKDLDNKIIPTALALLGAAAACISARGISLELIVGGMITGLASTGLHQAFKQLIEGGKHE
ncbi:MAG: phage holin family protein [Clostridiales bacterium]|nr:phage holin family protein [Clostridiales bacterium]